LAVVGDVAVAGRQGAAAASHVVDLRNPRRWIGLTYRAGNNIEGVGVQAEF
jgi:hypothetical protein